MKIALLGIDGSGKSTVAVELKKILGKKGYDVKIIPFHKWVFADIFRDKFKFGKMLDRDRKGRNAPYAPSKKSFSSYIKPPIAFIDNLIFYLINKPYRKNQIYIYDRFICATQIKFKALNYHVNWFKNLWWNITPDYVFVFDVDIDESLQRQMNRNDLYLYTKEQLTVEREIYKSFAEDHGFTFLKQNSMKNNMDIIIEVMKNNQIL